MKLRRLPLILASLSALVAGAIVPSAPVAAASHQWLNCTEAFNCAEVANPQEVFGSYYVGHDEPSTLFYSNHAGSGNNQRYVLTLPSDPPPSDTTGSFNFMLHPAFWFGMAMCDDQSYPESQWTYPGAGTTCTPDSDVNNVTYPNPSSSQLSHHAGTAFMEMQFYPPGWALWPPGVSCSATQWCAALNIDSLSEDPVTGQSLNKVCQSLVGVEYVNFAFITKDGTPIAPPNPVQATTATFDPTSNSDVLFMNSGDQIAVTMHDSPDGFFVGLQDLTQPGNGGTMVASAKNGFGMVQFAPPPSNACNNIPYNFHPMYNISSNETRVIWAAHSYNISFADEIGHFDYCSHVATDLHQCQGSEGSANFPGSDGVETGDKDDTGCFNAPAGAGFVQVSGCIGTNTPGFDGVPYQNAWPTAVGPATNVPSPILFTSPKTGASYNLNYSKMAFEADLPRIEAADLGGTCNRTTGANCTDPPPTDDGVPATFYPYFSAITTSTACQWAIGNLASGPGVNSFGASANAEYGPLYPQWYLVFGGGGATLKRFNDFQQALSNPCPA